MRSPRLARALVDLLIPPSLRDAVLGDLDELFARESISSPARAWARYWYRTTGVLWHLGFRSSRAAASSPALKGDGVMATILTDLWRGARLLIAQPGYALAAVLTLALAMGANTLIFTMANVLVLRPLPIAEPDRLAWIFATGANETSWRGTVSLPEYAAFRDQVSAITHTAAWQRKTFTLRDDAATERVLAHVVIGDLHGLWGLRAVRGRTLSRADERAGSEPVVVLSHRFWQTRWGGRDEVIGDEVRLDGGRHVIVGVLTPDIELGNLSEVDVWIPYRADPTLAATSDRTWRALGRLAGDATHEQAHAQVAAVAQSFTAAHADADRTRSARVGGTRDALGAPNTWVVLSLLIAVVGFLLLLACANVMNLLIARLIARRAELAVRTALGATRGRIVRQIVAESLVLGLAGGAAGVALARGGLAAVHAVAYEPFFRQLTIDWRVLAFAGGLAFLAPLVFSVAPALRMLRGEVRAALTDASARNIGGRGSTRTQSALVVLQVTLAVALLVVSALIVQSMRTVSRIDVGYDTRGLLSTQLQIPDWKVKDDGSARRLRAALVARARTLPGVSDAALSSVLPGLQFPRTVQFSGGSAPADGERPLVGLAVVTRSYFGVLRIPIVAGRAFAESDAATPSPVAVVSRETARRFFGSEHRAIGEPLAVDVDERLGRASAMIVGVAADVAPPDLLSPVRPLIYLLDAHVPLDAFSLIVRAAQPEALSQPMRTAIREVDDDLAAYQMRTVEEAFDDEFSSNRLLVGFFVAFAVIAVLLATCGLYAVMSYAVSRRTAEIAVRLALGASTRAVVMMLARHSFTLAAAGVGLGVVLALLIAQAARSVLYGVGPGDIQTYAACVALTLAAAVVATSVPTRRALGIDPASGLRES